ncbi:MAG: RNA methyltransferase [Anaerolineales bacterium]|nr:RNA methyltransferase [Anaerolineales bacterium]MCB8967002.1 RNA methyltransferase [Ardenticatenaceae bacterium]
MITSPGNSKVKYIRRLQSERRFRQREQAFVVEGTRWVSELAGLVTTAPINLFYTETWAKVPEHAAILHQLNAATQPVTEAVMAAMSDTDTPQGVLAVLPHLPRPLPPSPNLLLILDGISTPGNLGTMLRTAAAAGVDGVLLGPGSVDVYNPKVVRASMGALLRLPIHSLDWDEMATVTKHMSVWAAVVDEDARAYTAVSWQSPSALMIGGEAWGISDEGRRLATGCITIPIQADTESLNAAIATGIILFEAVRQRTPTY